MSAAADPARARRPEHLVAVTGLGLAVAAEAASIGLLGLSGWFITACAMAGAAAFSSFSFVAPSGGVRAFALARISGNYGKRLVLHRAALRRVAAARVGLFATAAVTSRSSQSAAWSGELLDRSIADADVVGMALIQGTAPVTLAVAMTLGGALAVGLAVSVDAAAVLAAGVTLIAVVAHRAPEPARSAQDRARAELRAEVVTAMDAWVEMASLGAAGHLASRTTARMTALAESRATTSRRRSRFSLLTGLVSLATLAGTLGCALGSGDGAPALVFAALITAGVLANAELLPSAAEAHVDAAAAKARLLAPQENETRVPPAMRTWVSDHEIGFGDYALPEAALRRPRVVTARMPRNGILLVTGRSGSGKSTLLRALANSLRAELDADDGRPAVTAVAADDYLFTGTLAANLRLADPHLTDLEVTRRLSELWLDRGGLTSDTLVGNTGRELSGGELRRVFLARALATRPHVLVVDEPTTGLDGRSAEHVLRVLAELSDTAVVLAVHSVPPALAGLHRVAIVSLDGA